MLLNEYIAIGIFIALTVLVGVIAIVLGVLFGPKRPAGKKSIQPTFPARKAGG